MKTIAVPRQIFYILIAMGVLLPAAQFLDVSNEYDRVLEYVGGNTPPNIVAPLSGTPSQIAAELESHRYDNNYTYMRTTFYWFKGHYDQKLRKAKQSMFTLPLFMVLALVGTFSKKTQPLQAA